MRFIKFFALIFSLLPSVAFAGFANGVGPATCTMGPSTTCVITLNGTTTGDMIDIVVGYNSATLTSITISGEANATIIAGAAFSNAGDTFAHAYLPVITSGGNKTITVNFSGSAFGSAAAKSYSGQDPASQPDVVPTPITSTSGDPTINPTTTTNNALIVSTASSNATKPTASGTGYSAWSFPNPGFYAEVEDNLDVGAAGSKTVTFGSVTNSTWGINAVAFKAASGAPAQRRTDHPIIFR